MPKLEPKLIQKELDQQLIWPVYWLYGTERMKSRELLKRIRSAVFPAGESPSALFGMSEENLDGVEVDAETVIEAAQSLSLGGGLRLVVIRDAHALKNAEKIAPLLGPRRKLAELSNVCVFLSKDFDQRKKVSKLLLEQAAVVPCDEVAESEREAWIHYLAKRRGLSLGRDQSVRLVALDPWTLDIIDQELEKFSLDPEHSGETFLGGLDPGTGSEAFLEAFFKRDFQLAIRTVENFADKMEEALPLLGLFGWNVRHLALLIAEQNAGTRVVKMNPYAAEKLKLWLKNWKLEEVIELQKRVEELDFGLKQTPLLPVGLWSNLVFRFCR